MEAPSGRQGDDPSITFWTADRTAHTEMERATGALLERRGIDVDTTPQGGPVLMAKRMILMLATLAVILGAVGFLKFRQIQGAIAQAAAFVPPPEAVTTIVAQQERWPSTLRAIGTVVAV